jgi:hypothetical protein
VHGRQVAVEHDHVVAGAGRALHGCRAVVDHVDGERSRSLSARPLAVACRRRWRPVISRQYSGQVASPACAVSPPGRSRVR